MKLCCTRCGGKIGVDLAWEGRAHLQYQVVDGFYCEAEDCYQSWDKDGEPL